MSNIAAKVDAWLFATLPERPNGDKPIMPQERAERPRSKSNSRGRHHQRQEDDNVQNPRDYGEEIEKKRQQAKKAMRSVEKQLTERGEVDETLHAILFSFLNVKELEAEQEEIKRISLR